MGLGSILSRVTSVTDSMVEASSLGLADALTEEERSLGMLYPRIERSALYTICLYLRLLNTSSVREISADIAKQVIRDAQRAVRLLSLIHF